ncbi:helix-turn-helix domain-containing protein [Flavobacterium silvaticum]|uniref:AraC family transcriptional regulator n=1 Tax=Flavobacterium silvaticum TaxID=1852020 RepID=A0A972FM50_9FLAO|nr:helix-turn-helix domain-containing protein [Flavobacterium silvaticum]NMH28187.1 AraC family transcriptional regulator [Flavobacterium silvaticum]
MEKSQSITDFYKQKFNSEPENYQPGAGHFNVFRMEDCFMDGKSNVKYSRREFFKISLMRGKNRYHYADKSIEIDGPTLMFFSPHTPYNWEPLDDERSGYFCIFTEPFFTDAIRSNINDLPMFIHGGKPGYLLSDSDDAEVTVRFQRMIEEINSDYPFKYDLLRTLVMELVHFALKREPSENLYRHADANARITNVFMELLERQFPIENVDQRFQLRSPGDFADSLSVHVNHLNRAVKTVTGKTTSSIIGERLASEAMALLKHTDWNVSQIGYSLGFEEASHFNNFFRKHAAQSPMKFRTV